MAAPKVDWTGRRYGRLVVQQFVERRNTTQAYYLCVCDCGTHKIIAGTSLRGGRTKSCGCLAREAARTGRKHTIHGLYGTPIHKRWRSMLQRCCDTAAWGYKHYGGRGITVCERWRTSLVAFYADMGEPPRGKQLERINNELGYFPGNCRWATATEQAQNRRSNRLVTYQNKTQTIGQWSKELGWPKQRLLMRLRAGWTVAEAMTTPVNPLKQRAGFAAAKAQRKRGNYGRHGRHGNRKKRP